MRIDEACRLTGATPKAVRLYESIGLLPGFASRHHPGKMRVEPLLEAEASGPGARRYPSAGRAGNVALSSIPYVQ